MPTRIYISFLRMPLVFRFLFIAMLVFLGFGITIHLLEPDTFPTVFEGIWWAIITASTVGYGDYAPKSMSGRITGLILILVGAGFVSSYFGSLAATAITRQEAFSEGKVSFKGRGHIIIIGWNERSKELIHKLANAKNPQKIVLIDATLSENPAEKLVHFIKGKSNEDDIILKSDIANAEKVLITADRGIDELQADMNSIVTLLTIKGLCPEVKVIVEILTAEQLMNAKRAGADEVIQSNKLTSVFMVNSLHSNGDGLLSDFIHQLQENRLTAYQVNAQEIGKTVSEIHAYFLNKETILVGIKRGGETILNPSRSVLIEQNDQLLVFK